MTLGIPTPVQVASGRQHAYKNVDHLALAEGLNQRKLL